MIISKYRRKSGDRVEREVAELYRRIGASRVERNVDLAGNQIDVYVELETPARLQHCIAVEVKDWSQTVGIDTVNKFAAIVNLLRQERVIHEGVIVSSRGFSRQARAAAEAYGIQLLEASGLEKLAASPSWKDGRLLPDQWSHLMPSGNVHSDSVLRKALIESAYAYPAGVRLSYYLDFDLVQTEPALLQRLVHDLTKCIREADRRMGGAQRLGFIGNAGGPVGALGLVGMLTATTGIPGFIILLKRGFYHRGCIRVLNKLDRKTRVILVTDVITGGFHLRIALDILRKHLDLTRYENSHRPFSKFLRRLRKLLRLGYHK